MQVQGYEYGYDNYFFHDGKAYDKNAIIELNEYGIRNALVYEGKVWKYARFSHTVYSSKKYREYFFTIAENWDIPPEERRQFHHAGWFRISQDVLDKGIERVVRGGELTFEEPEKLWDWQVPNFWKVWVIFLLLFVISFIFKDSGILRSMLIAGLIFMRKVVLNRWL